MRKRGFTLVELLVVIAIMAILVAMIMPVLLEAKDAARMRTCMANLKQLGTAVQAYIDDNNGFGLPVDTTYTPHSVVNPWVLYMKPLKSYVGQALFDPRPDDTTGRQIPNVIWVCAGDVCRGDPKDANNRPCWWHWGSSYMYPGPTAYVSPSTNDATDPFARDATTLPRKPMTWLMPRRDMLLSDYWFDFHNGHKVTKNVDHPSIKWPIADPNKTDVRCINILFLDMHAAAVTPDERDVCVDRVTKSPPFGDNPYP